MLMIYLIEYNNKNIQNAYAVSRRIAKQILNIPFLVAINLIFLIFRKYA